MRPDPFQLSAHPAPSRQNSDELSQKAASLSFEALERFPKMHFLFRK
jgi:hypothetical protein